MLLARNTDVSQRAASVQDALEQICAFPVCWAYPKRSSWRRGKRNTSTGPLRTIARTLVDHPCRCHPERPYDPATQRVLLSTEHVINAGSNSTCLIRSGQICPCRRRFFTTRFPASALVLLCHKFPRCERAGIAGRCNNAATVPRGPCGQLRSQAPRHTPQIAIHCHQFVGDSSQPPSRCESQQKLILQELTPRLSDSVKLGKRLAVGG
jgi:hypothetical protein